MSRSNPFSQEIHFEYGSALPLSPFVRRLVAHNPGPLTFKGTNVYVLGRGEVAVLDPGPDDDDHLETLIGALKGETITRILVTHTHKDHCGAVARLQAETGATTYGFKLADRSGTLRGAYGGGDTDANIDANGAKAGLSTDFADTAFLPDVELEDGDRVEGLGWCLTALHTPGHAPDHICYALPQEKALFTGDHIMPWSTSVIAPPEGNMQHYMDSLTQLMSRDDELYLPGHGGRVRKPKRLVRAYIMHRQWRENSIVEMLADSHRGIDEIVPLLYPDLEEGLRPAAALNVLAHLEHLEQKGRLQRIDGQGLAAVFTLP